jgi:ABC-type phosphate transport system substrate-binding protein
VADVFSTSNDQICLIYSGKILKDDEDLKKHGMKERFQLFSNLFYLLLFIDIKDGVTIHLVIRAPKSDTTANVSAGPTSSGTQAEVIIYISFRKFR